MPFRIEGWMSRNNINHRGLKNLFRCLFTPLEIMDRCSAAGLGFRIIPAGFNPLRQRLRGECPAGISNGVYLPKL